MSLAGSRPCRRVSTFITTVVNLRHDHSFSMPFAATPDQGAMSAKKIGRHQWLQVEQARQSRRDNLLCPTRADHGKRLSEPTRTRAQRASSLYHIIVSLLPATNLAFSLLHRWTAQLDGTTALISSRLGCF